MIKMPIGELADKKIDEALEKEVETNFEAFKEYNDSMENYIGLMNTFLNRRERRKLSRYKGFKSFSDRIYNGRK